MGCIESALVAADRSIASTNGLEHGLLTFFVCFRMGNEQRRFHLLRRLRFRYRIRPCYHSMVGLA